jgi:hypothetical protein
MLACDSRRESSTPTVGATQLLATGHLGMNSSAVYQALRLRYSYKWNNQLTTPGLPPSSKARPPATAAATAAAM